MKLFQKTSLSFDGDWNRHFKARLLDIKSRMTSFGHIGVP